MEWPKINADTSIEEVKKIHEDIWNYAIEHGEKPETPYASDCAVCEYVIMSAKFCRDCPIIWPENSDRFRVCYGVEGLYNKWDSKIGQEKTELARQIRDLPWKFESEEDS